jgi:transcriptional regulator with XRE-family HTH domain
MSDATADTSATDRDIGRAITLLRVVRGWSQDDLAKAAGIPNSSISEYERGRKIPELATLERLLRAMEFPLSAIDYTRNYIANLMAGTFVLAPPVSAPFIPGPPPVSSSAADWEIDQAAAEIGRAMARYSRIALHLLRRRPAPG